MGIGVTFGLGLNATLAAAAVWLVLLCATLRVARRRGVRSAPATANLGPERPAIAGLLYDRGVADAPRAATATLLDLAARGQVELYQSGLDPHQMTIRVRSDDLSEALAPYERRVLDRVAEVASRGTAPLSALSFADRAEAEEWAAGLRDEVYWEARAAGLIGPRLGRAHRIFLIAAAVMAALVGGIAVLVDEMREPSTEYPPLVSAVVVTLMAGTFMIFTARSDWGEGVTVAGRAVTARWLGVREWLRGRESSADQPPRAMIAALGPYLGYAVALRTARLAEDLVDFGPVRRDLLWSPYSGRWRRVRLTYPDDDTRYGASLGRLAFNTFFGLFLGFIGFSVAGYLTMIAFAVTIETGWPVFWLALLLDAVVLFFLGRAVLRWPYRLARTAFERRTVTVEGWVLRVEAWQGGIALARGELSRTLYHLVLDDGVAEELTAWIVPDPLAEECRVGRRLSIIARTWSRRVLALSVVALADAEVGDGGANDDEIDDLEDDDVEKGEGEEEDADETGARR